MPSRAHEDIAELESRVGFLRHNCGPDYLLQKAGISFLRDTTTHRVSTSSDIMPMFEVDFDAPLMLPREARTLWAANQRCRGTAPSWPSEVRPLAPTECVDPSYIKATRCLSYCSHAHSCMNGSYTAEN